MKTRELEWEDRYGTVWRLWFVPGYLDTHLSIKCFFKEPELRQRAGTQGGFADFDLEFELEGRPGYGHLGFIKVNHSYRRRGMASYLVKLGTDWLESRGRRGMWGRLEGKYDTAINRNFYRRNGFSIESDGLVIIDF